MVICFNINELNLLIAIVYVPSQHTNCRKFFFICSVVTKVC